MVSAGSGDHSSIVPAMEDSKRWKTRHSLRKREWPRAMIRAPRRLQRDSKPNRERIRPESLALRIEVYPSRLKLSDPPTL